MNNEALSNIEARWLGASGGPWTVLDMRPGQVGMRFTSKRAMNAFLNQATTSDGRVHLDAVYIDNFEDAKAAGACDTIEQWVKMLEERLFKSEFDELAERFRVVVTKSPREYQTICDAVDKATFRGKETHHEEPSYSFAISPQAKPEDVELLRRAPEDLGNLIEEVRKSWAKIDELRAALRQSRDEAEEAKKRADAATRVVDQFREVAAKVASL